MVLLNYVLTITRVLLSPSQSRWNYFTEQLLQEARQSIFAPWMWRCSNNLLRNCCYYRLSSSFDPVNSKGFLSWTLISFKSFFFISFFMDLLSVFLGLSSSVFTLEALSIMGSSTSKKLISFSQFLRNNLSHDLLDVISVTLELTSICISLTYSINFLNPQLLMFLCLKLKSSSVTDPTCLHETLARSFVYSASMVFNRFQSVVISVRSIFLMIWLSLPFSFSISYLSKLSKAWKYFSTASLHSLIESI